MKRSEMLQILEEAIDDNYDYATDTGVSYDYDTILKVLEEAGMLPPFINDWVEHTCGKYEICLCHNVWEPEEGLPTIEEIYEYEIMMEEK